jgi:acetate---CoA ligase (ADP-forming)
LNQSHDLHNFLWPESVGVIGASPDRTRLRGRLVYMLKQNGYPGRIVPITPSHSEVEGLPTVPSVTHLDQPLDLVVLALPAEVTLTELRRCASAGIRNAVVITSGFAEDSDPKNQALQAEMTDLARQTGMRICGPNNVGFYNAAGRVAATFSQTLEVTEAPGALRIRGKRAAIISQSGAVGFGLFWLARR